jgi:predicted phage tail protein
LTPCRWQHDQYCWWQAAAAGGKGGGGGATQRVPTEERDSLNSSQYITVVDLLSEGEIQGLKNGLQSIFLDNTPYTKPKRYV